MVKVGIIGATGYSGAELVRILTGHFKVELAVITSRQYAGIKFDKVYPSMEGIIDIECKKYSKNIYDMADLFFLALPHKLPMEIVPELVANGKRVIDLSADFRFSDISLYEKHYQPHIAKKTLQKSVYGLCEVYADKIKEADIIGNPGCYPTSTLLPLIPLLKEAIIDYNTIIVDSKSGVSGAGRSPSLTNLYCEVNESFKAYKVVEHRHAPEIEEILSEQAGKEVKITFVPHLVPMTRGIQTTIYTNLIKKVSEKDITECLKDYYSNRYFVRICKKRIPDTLNVKGTNYCDIRAVVDKRNNRLILLSAIDNLVKGAAGQAVQNMNIMIGIDERVGLDNTPYLL